MRQLKIMAMLLLCSILYACPSNDEESHQYFVFINKSDGNIEYQQSLGSINISDTFTYDCKNVLCFSLLVDSMRYFKSADWDWEKTLSNHSSFQILIMNLDIYNHYKEDPCDTIRKYVPILHRYQLTLEDLQRMNWTVVYPPEE